MLTTSNVVIPIKKINTYINPTYFILLDVNIDAQKEYLRLSKYEY